MAVWCWCYETPEPDGPWVYPNDEHADTCGFDEDLRSARRVAVMAATVVALTNDYVTAVLQRLLALEPDPALLTDDDVREALHVAAVATDQTARQPDLFGSTP